MAEPAGDQFQDFADWIAARPVVVIGIAVLAWLALFGQPKGFTLEQRNPRRRRN